MDNEFMSDSGRKEENGQSRQQSKGVFVDRTDDIINFLK
jgi:hypothetical protein